MKNISKSFFTTKVLDNVQFSLKSGEIHALMGENGAGKSTLMKVLTGVYTKDSGEILLDGIPVNFKHPIEAEKKGICFVYQELNSVPDMTVEENLFLGRELRKTSFGVLNKKAMKQKTKEVSGELGVSLNPDAVLGNLSVGQQQLVEIAKALLVKASVIILDEPTAALSEKEVQRLFSVVRTLKTRGVSFIYISHRMEEIFELCDRVTVMRDGQYIGTEIVSKTGSEKLIEMMIGRKLGNLFCKEQVEPGKEVLQVSGLTKNRIFSDISFSVREGEILGVSGLMGAGRTEIMKTIFGCMKADSGTITIFGETIPLNALTPKLAREKGIAFITEDRKTEGLMIEESIEKNISLTNFNKITRHRTILDKQKEQMLSTDAVKKFRIKSTGIDHKCGFLSGGNQQKVVFAKWLSTDPKILILDEPTRGVDVGAKQEIYGIIMKMVKKGTAVIMVSSDLPEIIGLSDRVMVISEGKNAGILPKNLATQKNIMTLATGGTIHADK
jgi:ribose transport system ATP-binding protein